MNPSALPPALLPDTFLLLRYLLIAALLLYLPFLGIIIAGSAASLVLNFFGRENRDDRSLRLSREWIEAVTVNRWVLLLLGLLPYPAIAYTCQRLLGGRASLPAIAWLIPFGALLAGCLLLSLYRSGIRQTTELPAASFGAGTAGLLAMISAAFLSFLLLGTLVNPAKLPLVRSNLVFILSWHSLVEFLLFLALSFGLAGGIALRFLGRSKAGEAGGGPDYEARVRTTGTSFALAGALAVPPLVVFYLITLPVTGLSKVVFAMAATVPILALAVFALLYLLPGKEEGRPGDRVSALFVLMFLAVILCYQTAVANAFQGLSAPPGPLAAETVSKEGKGMVKPAAGEDAALEKGKKVYDTVCSVCHRFDVKIVGPPYNDVVPKYKGNVEKLKAFIRNPVKVNPSFPAMPKPAIKEDEIDAVARYLLFTAKGGK
ncbi:cytochrome c [Candidatus Deferrimicrobium sp.]|uniref:c-type cytochrome n=1 Tax=Candidatus Deferrimicrobium sp. TaxID=3060586 RepID=UPI002ED578E5